MAETTPPPPQALPRRRRWPYLLAGLAVLAATVLVAIPYVIRWQALVWLRDHGHTGANIGDVDFNPFSGRLALLALGGGTGEGEELDLDQIAAQVDWLPLLGRRVMVRDIAMDRVTIDVKKRADGTLVVGRLELPPPAQDREQPVAEPEQGNPWLLGLGNLDLRNVTVRYSDPRLDTSLLVQELHIDPALQWEPDRDTAFRAELELDGEHWSLSGTMRPFADAPSVDTRVQLRGRVQRRYPRLLGQLGIEELTLEAATDTHLQASYDLDSGEIHLRHQSQMQLRQLQMNRGGTKARVGSLDWDGTITVDGTTETPRCRVDGTLVVTGYGADLPDQGGGGSGESLRWQGPLEVQVGPDKMSLDLSGVLAVAGLTASHPAAGVRAASLASLQLDDLRVELVRTVAAGELELSASGALALQEMEVDHDQARATVGNVVWEGVLELSGPPAAPRASTRGTLSVNELQARAGEQLQVQQGALEWEGGVEYTAATEDTAGQMSTRGELTLKDLSAQGLSTELQRAGLDELALALAPLRVDLPRGEGPLRVEHSGTLRLAGVEASAGAGSVSDAALTWEGTVRVGAGQSTELNAEGTLDLTGLDAGLISPSLQLAQPDLHWQGTLAFARSADTDAAPDFGLAGDLSVKGTRVSNRAEGLSLLELDGFSLEGASVSAPRQVSAKEIRLDGLKLLENAPTGGQDPAKAEDGSHVLSLAALRVESLATHGEKRLEIAAIRLAGLQAWLTKGKDGEFAFQKALPRSEEPTAEAEEPAGTEVADAAPTPAADEPPFILSLGEAHLDGDNRLLYLDSSVDPPFQFEVNPFELHVGKVDSGNQAGMSPVTLRARTGRYATIEVDGEVGLFAARPTLHLTGKAEGINLPPATALAQRHVGYRIKSGLLDADLRVDIDQGILDSETELTANKLELVKLDPKDLDELDKQLGLPLNAALDLLRDSDDNINLVIPVQGDIGDPDIDIGDAVRKALVAGMSKAVSTGALSYLATLGSAVFLPVGAAVAAGKVFSLATALNFAPVPFAAGDVQLAEGAREQLDTLAALLDDRPKLRLTLCGYAAPFDRLLLQAAELRRMQLAEAAPPPTQPHPPVDSVELPEIPERQLLDLALHRGEAVKGYLVETRGIAPGRLLVCSPELAKGEGATSRVDVSL